MVKPEIKNYNAGLRQPVHLIIRNRPRNVAVDQCERAIEMMYEAEKAGVPVDLRNRVWRIWEMAVQLEMPKGFSQWEWLTKYSTPW